MLKKELRLSKRSDIKDVLEKGKMIHTPLFGVLVVPALENKWGWIISKKISKYAVDRNRIRRLLSEVVRNNWDKQKNNYWRLVLGKKAIVGKTYDDIEREIVKIIEN